MVILHSMKRPIFVGPLSDAERESLEAGLRSPDAFTLRRCQILLASSRGKNAYQIAHDDGFREIVAVEVADTESEATYHELFRSLKARGLRGVELIVSGDHEGLKAAVSRHSQGASHQRCQVHYSRNLLGMVGYARRKELAADLRAIFAAAAREQAPQIASSVAEKWHKKKANEKVSEHIEEHIEECLACLPGLPGEPSKAHPHHQRPRTSQPGDKAQDAGGEDLPEQRGVSALGERLGGRAI
jgi:Transposase, Mutator family